jgi:hypothetical protein
MAGDPHFRFLDLSRSSPPIKNTIHEQRVVTKGNAKVITKPKRAECCVRRDTKREAARPTWYEGDALGYRHGRDRWAERAPPQARQEAKVDPTP